jgi:hypothetical protein
MASYYSSSYSSYSSYDPYTFSSLSTAKSDLLSNNCNSDEDDLSDDYDSENEFDTDPAIALKLRTMKLTSRLLNNSSSGMSLDITNPVLSPKLTIKSNLASLRDSDITTGLSNLNVDSIKRTETSSSPANTSKLSVKSSNSDEPIEDDDSDHGPFKPNLRALLSPKPILRSRLIGDKQNNQQLNTQVQVQDGNPENVLSNNNLIENTKSNSRRNSSTEIPPLSQDQSSHRRNSFAAVPEIVQSEFPSTTSTAIEPMSPGFFKASDLSIMSGSSTILSPMSMMSPKSALSPSSVLSPNSVKRVVFADGTDFTEIKARPVKRPFTFYYYYMKEFGEEDQ